VTKSQVGDTSPWSFDCKMVGLLHDAQLLYGFWTLVLFRSCKTRWHTLKHWRQQQVTLWSWTLTFCCRMFIASVLHSCAKSEIHAVFYSQVTAHFRSWVKTVLSLSLAQSASSHLDLLPKYSTASYSCRKEHFPNIWTSYGVTMLHTINGVAKLLLITVHFW